MFVPDALPGELVELKLRKRRRKLQEAELERVVEPSPDRVQPQCEYFGRCGGCALQHLAYPAQVEFKQRAVAQALARIARVEPDEWLPAFAGEPWGYRRRARLGVKYVAGKERVLVGFRERAAPYITDMAHCPVLAPPLGRSARRRSRSSSRARAFASACRRSKPPSPTARAPSCCACSTPPSAADVEAFAAFGARHDVDMYLQPGGPGTVAPIGRARTLRYSLAKLGITLEFLPTDFVQVNARVNEELVATAIELAEVRPTDSVLDLYCGLGNFSLPFARRARELLGVEGEAGLVARAVRNAALNDVENARFVTADLAQPDWSFFREPRDVVVLDPPRTGAEARGRGDGPDRAAADRLRLVPPGDARARRASARRASRLSGCARCACSTCSRTRITSRRSRCSSADSPRVALGAPAAREARRPRERRARANESRIGKSAEAARAAPLHCDRLRRHRALVSL